MDLTPFLLGFNAFLMAAAGRFTFDSVREKEPRAARVGAGPHTPALFESAFNCGKGACITTILPRWFAGMGYRAAAHHIIRIIQIPV